MERFPEREADIRTLAQPIATGLIGNPADFISIGVESEETLNNQERGKDWEYRVIAKNKTGEGFPSNTVAAVLWMFVIRSQRDKNIHPGNDGVLRQGHCI